MNTIKETSETTQISENPIFIKLKEALQPGQPVIRAIYTHPNNSKQLIKVFSLNASGYFNYTPLANDYIG